MGASRAAVATRALAAGIPSLLLHAYARYAFDQAREQAHRGDTGLGIAVLAGSVCLGPILCFGVDVVVQALAKRVVPAVASLAVLALLCVPLGGFACNGFGSGENMACALTGRAFEGFLRLFRAPA